MMKKEIVESDEWLAWYRMTPAERWRESEKLWSYFLTAGGSLDREPDSQSPFSSPRLRRPVPAHGRTGVHFLRRGGIQP